VIRDKRAFDGLISNLAFHINELESLITRSGTQTFQSMLPTLSWNMSVPAIRLLDAAAAGSDMGDSTSAASDRIPNNTTSEGHLYLRNQIRERARVVQGDAGVSNCQGRRHIFEDNRISGETKVVQGNVSQGFMDDFWKN
jgi:hypothetical protein